MNYELAVKLKEAGFPQIQKGRVVLEPELLPVLEPTLSELIEACGDGFDSLDKMKDYKDGETFCWSTNLYKTVGGVTGYSTPEEAVAKLWLAINNK